MASVGGSIQEVSIRGRLFAVAADADGERDMGGFSVERQMNGNGTSRKILTRKPWMLGGLKIDIDESRADQAFLQEVASDPKDVKITATFASGFTFEGEGTVQGDIKVSTMDSTAEIELGGGGQFTAQ